MALGYRDPTWLRRFRNSCPGGYWFDSNTDLSLEAAGVGGPSGHVKVNGVSRTSVNSIYAAGDCTAMCPPKHVAPEMQGPYHMAHILLMRCARCADMSCRKLSSHSPELRLTGVSEGHFAEGAAAAILLTHYG